MACIRRPGYGDRGCGSCLGSEYFFRLFGRSRAKVGEGLCQEVQAHGRLGCRRFLVVFTDRQRYFFATETQDRSGPCFTDSCFPL